MSSEQNLHSETEVTQVSDFDLPVSVVDPEKQPSVEARIAKLRRECDRFIFAEENDNYLFFTQYGGAVTQEKVDNDKNTDLDLRLVCFTLPSPEEQDRIRRQFQDIAGSIPVELYFHSYDKYVKAEVGETGSVSVLESIQKGLDPKTTITTLEHPSMVSFYTFATMRFFTDQEADLSKHLEDLVKRQQAYSPDELEGCTYDALKPDVLLESMTLDKEGIIEWIHLYLKSFLNDYYEFRAQSEIEKSNPDLLFSYLKRLSKYLLRIAFGVTVIDSDLAEIKANYLRDIRGGILADQIHFDMCGKYSRNWYNANTHKVFLAAVQLREQGNKEEISNSFAPFLTQSIEEMENQLLFLLQLGSSGILRKEKFSDEHDFLTELAITNLLAPESAEGQTEFGSTYETYAEGETIVSQHDTSNDLLVISQKKQDGSPNGTYTVTKNGKPVHLNRTKTVVGELASLLKTERSSSLVATSDVEVISVNGDRFSELWEMKLFSGKKWVPLLRYFLRSYFNSEAVTAEQRKAFLLSFSLLNYFSSEFIQYLYENIDFGASFSEENHQQHLLSEYHIDFFAEAVADLLQRKKVSHTIESVPKEKASQLLFQAGEVLDDFFVAAHAEDSGGVELTFANGETTILHKNQIVGESALLFGNKPALYTARILPGTMLYRIQAKDFLNATSTTDTLFAKLPSSEEDGTYTYEEVTAIELFFEVGLQCLDRLNSEK